jgi:hypothetical protein
MPSLFKKRCEHCQSVIPHGATLCPHCDHWVDPKEAKWPWLELLIKLRLPLFFLTLLLGFMIWAIYHTMTL